MYVHEAMTYGFPFLAKVARECLTAADAQPMVPAALLCLGGFSVFYLALLEELLLQSAGEPFYNHSFGMGLCAHHHAMCGR